MIKKNEIKKTALRIVCCPFCKRRLIIRNKLLFCHNCLSKFNTHNNIFHLMPSSLQSDQQLSQKKWDEYYKRKLKQKRYLKDYKEYLRDYFQDEYDQIISEKELDKSCVYLEIGCGPFFLGQEFAKKVGLVIGIDVSWYALKIAQKMLEKRRIKNYLLIQGDILSMPIKSESIDLIFGGGVIEHFKNTQICVNELYRVLKKRGISFNTVPYLNIGSITYRQLWGNIPNIFLLRQLAEFIHIRLLKSRHMRFGYEFSFLRRTLIKVHQIAGFTIINIENFKVKLCFEFIPKGILRIFFIFLAKRSSLFWPMVKVIAIK